MVNYGGVVSRLQHTHSIQELIVLIVALVANKT